MDKSWYYNNSTVYLSWAYYLNSFAGGAMETITVHRINNQTSVPAINQDQISQKSWFIKSS